jgi:hypothetical protein
MEAIRIPKVLLRDSETLRCGLRCSLLMPSLSNAKVEDVTLEKLGVKTTGLLHLTPHHMIFVAEGQPDAWVSPLALDFRMPCF